MLAIISKFSVINNCLKRKQSYVKDHRPKNLNLLTIRFPIPAIVSILHRLSGVVLFLLIPIILWGLSQSLASDDSFEFLHNTLTTPFAKGVIWILLAPFLY